MYVVFRVDASLEIGSGHVMRCLTLADALRQRGATCVFVSRSHPGHLNAVIHQRGFDVLALPVDSNSGSPAVASPHSAPIHADWLGSDWLTDAAQTLEAIGGVTADWLVVDHYALDRRWEQRLRERCRRIMVIDDLADRVHDCDLLLDQNLGRNARDYDGLVPEHCARLIGPRYALLRPEFAALRDGSLQRRQQPALRRLLITMGGVDQANATGAVLNALAQSSLPSDCFITVVMGAQSPWVEEVRRMAGALPWKTEVLVNVANMAELMAGADLAIGAAGSTAWERCCLGLPSVVVVLAENQRAIAAALRAACAAVVVTDPPYGPQVREALAQLLHDPRRFAAMSRTAADLVDGGGAARVTDQLLGWGIYEDHTTV